MSRSILVFIGIVGLLLLGSQGFAQTFIYDPERVGCDGEWGTAACWEVDNVDGCGSPQTAPPPTNATGCEVNIVINDDVTFDGDMVFGGDFGALTVNTDAELTINGNVTIASTKEIDFVTNGGTIDVIGSEGIELSSGTKQGQDITLTKLNFKGDGLGNVYTTNVDLNNQTEINVQSGGALVSHGDTKYSGTDANINVSGGFFRTKYLEITGNENKLNISNSGTVIIDEDVKFTGNDAGLVIGGSSEMEIGGDVQTQPNSSFEIEEGSVVRMCGSGENTPSEDDLVEYEENYGVTRYGCRILPVEWVGVRAYWNEAMGHAVLQWATVKEWESEVFEIERSINGIDDFKVIGEVEAAGWSDQIRDYRFEDKETPLKGGRVYYRIKQVGMKGSVVFSEIVAVQVPKAHASKGAWRAYPNPTKGDDFKVELMDVGAYNGEEITVKLISSTYGTQQMVVEDEFGLTPVLSDMLGKSSRGLWVLEISWGGQVEHLKVLKR